jgi:hypothetical protein
MSSDHPDSTASRTDSLEHTMNSEALSPDRTPATKASLCSLMADETRMRILQALYAVDSDSAQSDGLSFSTLRQRVAVEDSGRFNYHLDQLTTDLVTKRDDQYVLTSTGRRLVRALAEPTERR